MPAPFRISRSPDSDTRRKAADAGVREYLERLIKMIPAEVVGLFLVGKGVIPPAERTVGLIWVGICLLFVIAVRIYGTGDRREGKAPQKGAVAISAVAFLIWVYSLAWPFEAFGVYVPYAGSLAVAVWSFAVPLFYRGPIEA